MRFRRFAYVFSAIFFLSVLTFAGENAKPVKNVFLFIGDGLSIPQRMMTDEFLQRSEKRSLLINQFDKQAITSTSAANSFITDSAASGTAIACGEKTNNGRIGVDASGKRRLESVAEVARDQGRKVAIITSVTLNHATPAAFYGHNPSRGNYYQLGLDLIEANFDYYGGGGISQHNHQDDSKYKGDIYKLAEEAGYTVRKDNAGIRELDPELGKAIAVAKPGALTYALDKTEDDLRLADFVKQGIAFVDNDKGFFMMVEGGAIDWLCHANDAAASLYEVIEFDDAVRVAYEFYLKNPEDTLIVVTGDHETGGLTLGFAGTGYKSYIELLAAQKSSSAKLSGLIKKYKADDETNVWEDYKALITEQSGLVFNAEGAERQKGGLFLTEIEEKELEKAFHNQFPDGKLNKKSNALTNAVIKTLNNKSSVAWTSGAHTALPVSTTAIGKEARLFSNMIDNTDIAKRLKLVVQ